jgi:hypothetical protein
VTVAAALDAPRHVAANQSDHARTTNGIGFAKSDVALGRRLAAAHPHGETLATDGRLLSIHEVADAGANYSNPWALIVSVRILPMTESMNAETANGR